MEKEIKKVKKKNNPKNKKVKTLSTKKEQAVKFATKKKPAVNNKKINEELSNIKQENRNQKIEIIKLIKENNKLKNILLALILLLIIIITIFVALVNNHYKNVYHGPKEVKVINNVLDSNYVFLGDSITECYDLDKFFENYQVINSGVSGYTTKNILDKLPKMVYRYNPSKIFLLIGTNDIYKEKSQEEIINNISKIIDGIKENRKYAKLYIESIYPINSAKEKKRTNKEINEINKKIKALCKEKKVTYLNIGKLLMDDNKELRSDFSNDGLHLNDAAYQVITDEIKKYLD